MGFERRSVIKRVICGETKKVTKVVSSVHEDREMGIRTETVGEKA